MFKKERGITLVALVVTIVVLLILAGVSISMVLGNNGIVTKAQSAQGEQDKAYAREVVESGLKTVQIDHLTKPALATTAATAEEVKTAIGDTNFATGTGDAINYTAKSGKVYKVNINLTDYTVTLVEESK